jgi:hypothetical protein
MVLSVNAQNTIPARSIIQNSELFNYLKPAVKLKLSPDRHPLAQYFREQFSKNYFYDWKTNDARFSTYNSTYKSKAKHASRAKDHMDKFHAAAQWDLPSTYKNGKEVNAYALRHLARQHKMIDVSMMYYLDNKDVQYLDYFTTQMTSLNAALASGEYEKIKDGNGVYEAFRSGYRVLNWLKIHNLFLGEEGYSDEEQLTTIATLLQHGQHLYEDNQKFKNGNHQTKGMSSLALLSILFQDFEGTDKWYELSMTRLEEHLVKEINSDGFQFERTVHYHMADILNFYYVYQLAKINKMPVGELWESKLKSLFTTLTKIAYPDKTAPVLSDDTDEPWAERNDISGTMTMGYLLFEDAEFGFFAKPKVDSKMYWYLQSTQLDQLKNIDTKKPNHTSLFFPDTKYYIMREGYDNGDKVMVISAGLDADKPDHQHGDMLGIQATANGQIILPNYQVRYSLPDYELFKNSMVKNVALVDDQLQGKKYKGNKGGSGFGKFGLLPTPTTIAWETNENFDLYVGSHDGFEASGVNYTRQVVYVKDGFWIVKDNFMSNAKHTYKQVWQGHYTPEGTPQLLRSSFADAKGSDIYQLNAVDTVVSDGVHGKKWNIVSKADQKDFEFITVIRPYDRYNNGIDPAKNKVGDWIQDELRFVAKGYNLKSLSKGNEVYLFGVNAMKIETTEIQSNSPLDCYITILNNKITIYSLNNETSSITYNNKTISLNPGQHLSIDIQ